MARTLKLPARRPVDDLERRYRRARDPVARSHRQIVWQLAAGTPTAEVARAAGYSVARVREAAKRSREGGPDALGDRRHANPGAPPLLSPEQPARRREALGGPAGDGGLWTGRKVAAWMAAGLGRSVGEQRGWERPRRLGFTPQRPRPAETRADPAARAAFTKGGLAAEVQAARGARPAAAAEVWAEDEHRLGLPPVVRRVWAPRGRRPPAAAARRYQGLYVFGFVRPGTGRSRRRLLPTVSAEACGAAPREVARAGGIGPRRRAVLVVDRAGGHAAADLPVPAGVHLAVLPPYSPGLRPAERLWPLVAEAVANRAVADLGALEGALAARGPALRAAPTTVRARTRFAWRPTDAAGHTAG